MKLVAIFLLCIICTSTIAQNSSELKQFSLLPASYTQIDFRNDITENSNMFYYMNEYLYNGAGVSIGDINNDGLSDIYFTSTLGNNKLYLNQGDFKFSDITVSAGVEGEGGIKTGTNMVDINGDGYLDIFISKSGYKDPTLRKKVLYINNGNLTFTNRAKEYGLEESSYTTQSYFFDYDNDGDLDVYLLNHPGDFSKSMTIPATLVNGKLVYVEDTASLYVSDRLYENISGKFRDVTLQAGIKNHVFGLSASIADINLDGWQDVYVANDFNKPDYLYINNKNGTFTNKIDNYVNHMSFFSMGSDITDINNDGFEDIFVLDMAVEDPVRQKQLFSVNQNYDKFQLLITYGLKYQYPRNMLQLNNGDGSFSEIANYSNIAETDWSWAPVIADFNNDCWKDIYITNGLKRDVTDWDYKVFILDSIMSAMNKGKSVDLNAWLKSIPSVPTKNYFYHNNGSLKFDNYSDVWMDNPPSFSSGAAYGDLNNDGSLDLVVSNIDANAFVYKNNKSAIDNKHFLRFKFFKSRESMNEVYGAIVKITYTDGKIQTQHYNPQRGFLSTMEHYMHFGCGKDSVIKELEIMFKNDKRIVMNNVRADREIVVYESDAVPLTKNNELIKDVIFSSIENSKSLNYTHIENDFIDFKREPLIPYQCSRKGPYYAMADVNNDGLEDLYIGGAVDVEGQLFIQKIDGTFINKKQVSFSNDKKYEDMGAVYFDADGDGDNDLYVVSGGSQFPSGSILYQDRLYLNDGNANFTLSANAIPLEGFNGSCVITLDFDKDNDLDLFVGASILPGAFPKSDQCMLLQNNKGVFTNVIQLYAKDLENVGMVNDAVWQDINNDGSYALSIIGEWMPLKNYRLNGNQLELISNTVQITLPNTKDTIISMSQFTGWWNTIETGDINNDGLVDFVLGNRGTNAMVKGNYNEPVTIYAKDFDLNGSYDAVLGYYNHSKCYPLYSRDQLIDQLPSMRKKFIRYRDYSGKTLDDIFTLSEKEGMDVYKTHFLESGALLNKGNGQFSFIPFPERAQLSNINDFLLNDFTADGINDIIFVGNSKDPAVMIGVQDANSCMLLQGLNNGGFKAILPGESGLSVKGESRKLINLESKKVIFVIKNGDMPQVYNWE